MTGLLQGKTIVVTGASEGIGLACSKAYLKAGAQVVAIGRSQKKLSDAFNAHHGQVIQLPMDLLDKEACDNLVATVLNLVDKIDVFHANAGAYIEGNLIDNDSDEIRRAIELNYTVPIINMHKVLPHMIERGEGQVLITSSLAAHLDTSWEPVYSSAKTAVNKAARLTHDQVSDKGVRITTISPGPVRTELFKSWEIKKQSKVEQNLGVMEPHNIADTAMHILTRPSNTHIEDIALKPPGFNVPKCLQM